MLRRIRQLLAVASIVMVTLLFLDFTGCAAAWFGWMAKIQFLPALLAMNVAVIVTLIILTLLLGRIYCSVICPLGIMQDVFGALGKKAKKNRYSYSKAKNILRYVMLALMAIAIIAGIGTFVALLAPYSAYGRIAQSLFAPVWAWINNLLAHWAETHDSYAFYNVEVWLKGGVTLAVAIATLLILAFLAWRNGRTYCNTFCPVGTILGFLSKFAVFKPVINPEKCISCRLCERNCKASCIDIKGGKHIDYSRCVDCFDCIDRCPKDAISYSALKKQNLPLRESQSENIDSSRRSFLAVGAVMASAAVVKAQDKTVDGGLAAITEKERPQRKTRIVPPGALGIRNLESHCTACQLCVAACPNGVLRPSSDLGSLMQPESSYERGYCRPECTKCSKVCPTGAIHPITKEEKTSVQIGHAVWVKDNCVVLSDGVECGNCARHCPAGAIIMVHTQDGDENSPKIPAVNSERCIGCGACENLCPARPFSAIYVEGHERHRNI